MAEISVVIPTYNAAGFVAEAIQSAWQQQLRPLEVLVVDDGSSDGSPAIAEQAGARVLKTSRNLGPAGARNVGIEAARGAYVAFLDADDRWRPEHLGCVGSALDRFPDAVLACSGLEAFGRRSHIVLPRMPGNTPVRCDLTLAVRNPVPQLTAIVRRAALLKVGGYNPEMRFAEDYDLWQRLSRLGPFVFLHEVTADYRFHDAQASRARVEMLRNGWAVRQRAWKELSATLPPDEVASLRQDLTLEWTRELRAAWTERSNEPVRIVLAQAAWVPESEPIRRRWARKLRLVRPPWRVAAFIVDSIRPLLGRSSTGNT